MITIGTVHIDFRMEDESFAQQLYARWDSFFRLAFEEVAEEVLSAYDRKDEVLTIDALPLHLGNMLETELDEQFPHRLREALQDYFHELMRREGSELLPGVHRETSAQSALELLCFFLLHGYLPLLSDERYKDISLLLAEVIESEAYHFREFLEAYGHYDFLYKRLVFQFNDAELEEIVRVVQPSDSKFVNLYVRVQIRSYEKVRRPDVSVVDYRDTVWILVLAYLFAESRSRFSRKQLVMHTLRGLSAHFNLSVVLLIRILTDELHQLEQKVVQMPELWSILAEIRRDVRGELWALDGDCLHHAYRDIIAAVRFGKGAESVFFLSPENLVRILRESKSCRELLAQLQEPEIHALVGAILPQEKEFIVSYAHTLDRHKEKGTFSGKAGSDFRLLKWEFIFSVLFSLPLSAFSRKQFVLGVLQRLAAHYNQQVIDLLSYFYQGFVVLASATSADQGLRRLLCEWYEEVLLPLADTQTVKQMDAKAMKQWLLNLFGEETMLWGKEAYLEKWMVYALEERTELFRSLWKTGKLNEQLLMEAVNRTPTLQRLWLRRIGDTRILDIYRRWQTNYAALRSRFPEVYFLQSIAGYLSVWMVQLTGRAFSGWSASELLRFLIQRIRTSIPSGMSFEADVASALLKDEAAVCEVINQLKEREEMIEDKAAVLSLEVNNAGLMLLAPYLPRLFFLLGYLKEDKKSFKDTESRQRALFGIQYVVYGEEQEYAEHELSLNKLLVGYELESPLPRQLLLTSREKELLEEMISGVKANWDKVKNTSLKGFRDSFIKRRGNLILAEERGGPTLDKGKRWELWVEERAYDVLLDSIPWGFKMVKFPWMNGIIEVKWR